MTSNSLIYMYLTLCFFPILDCKPNPCHGRGVCHNSTTRFACTCQQGFTGLSCEIGASKYLYLKFESTQKQYVLIGLQVVLKIYQ